jgi:tyrosinase
VLQKHAIAIADTYQVDQARWKKAAADLRQPYWDWARNSIPPPEVISLQSVTITRPDGQRAQVPNPIYQYRFHPIDPSFPPPYSDWPTTLRQSTNGKDNVAALRK